MGNIIEFPFGDGKEGKEKLKVEKLTQEELTELIEPFRRGLKELYPTQVSDILGLVGFGEKFGNEIMVMGILLWLHLSRSEPIASTFIAYFVNKKLEKVSFLEAKNNYWDWKLMIETYQTKFNTKEMFADLQELREQILSGS